MTVIYKVHILHEVISVFNNSQIIWKLLLLMVYFVFKIQTKNISRPIKNDLWIEGVLFKYCNIITTD